MQATLGPKTQLRVLVAEDNPLNQLLATRLIEKLGHFVQVVSDGQLALNLLLEQTFDVVLMDLRMPVMDGLDAVRELRRRELTIGQHLPVIGISANTMDHDREQCVAVGMDEFVGKPLREAELAAALSRVFRKSREACPVTIVGDDQEAKLTDSCNLAVASTRLAGDESFLQQLIQLFLETVPQQIESLSAAMIPLNRNVISDAAHSIKGTIRYFAADPAYNAALQLEIISRSGATTDVHQSYDRLMNEIQRLRTDLQNTRLPLNELVTNSGVF